MKLLKLSGSYRPDSCELCGRVEAVLTRHHLIPRTRHRKRRVRRRFDRDTLLSRILWLCRLCHSHLHKVLTEKQLVEDYHSRDALLAHPDIARFVGWIRKKPAGFRPKGRLSRRR